MKLISNYKDLRNFVEALYQYEYYINDVYYAPNDRFELTDAQFKALTVGNRTIMMDAGQIILDIAGDERKEMTVPKLMTMYSGARGKALDNDRMLLSQ